MTRVELDMLESLRFPQMHDRHGQIAKAHENTFVWIFQDPQTYQKPWDNFLEWLSNDSGMYWIQGKAASGKSTLMRFVGDHPLTRQSLQNWSNSHKLTTGRFFFWNSGESKQRSHIGLLRSLLHEVLGSHKNLIPEVFPEEWENKAALAAFGMDICPEQWSLARLKEAFSRLIDLSGEELKLCFFIDGLDEYEGDPEDITQYFKDLAFCSVHTKFCVSSRPCQVFQDIYQGTPSLKLQDLTNDDI